MRLNLNLCKNSTEIARVRCDVSLLLCVGVVISPIALARCLLGRKTNNRKNRSKEEKSRSQSRESSPGRLARYTQQKKKKNRSFWLWHFLLFSLLVFIFIRPVISCFLLVFFCPHLPPSSSARTVSHPMYISRVIQNICVS